MWGAEPCAVPRNSVSQSDTGSSKREAVVRSSPMQTVVGVEPKLVALTGIEPVSLPPMMLNLAQSR